MAFLAVVLVLAEAGAAVVFFVVGPWPCGVLLAVAAVCTVVIAWQVRAVSREPVQAGYVERETIGF